jgi:hypothetical protein
MHRRFSLVLEGMTHRPLRSGWIGPILRNRRVKLYGETTAVSVRAELEQYRQNHQIMRREKPLLGMAFKSPGSGNKTQPMAPYEIL